MELVPVPKYLTPYGPVDFVPVADVPGHSHRMIINGNATRVWVPSQTKINKSTVTFFVRMWGAIRDGLDKYHYADARIDPPVAAAAQP
jgi:hypothetical protein